MVVEDLEKSNVILKRGHLIMEQEADMTLFYMATWDLNRSRALENGIKITIVLKKKKSWVRS